MKKIILTNGLSNKRSSDSPVTVARTVRRDEDWVNIRGKVQVQQATTFI
jgi:hypothetical protein